MIKTIYICDQCDRQAEDKKDFRAVGIYVNPELVTPQNSHNRGIQANNSNTSEALWCITCVIKYKLKGHLDGLASDQKKKEEEKPPVGFGEQIEAIVSDIAYDAATEALENQ